MNLGKPNRGPEVSQRRSLRLYRLPLGLWVWNTRQGTIKILETLVKKGLVEKETYTTEEGKTYPQYTISRTGEVYILGR